MSMERIIAFVITAVVIWVLKGVIKFGIKLALILVIGAGIVYFVFPELFPVIRDFFAGFIKGLVGN